MREDETYKDRLSEAIKRIEAFYPGKQYLNKKEVMAFTGLSQPSVDKCFKFNACNMVSVINLASQMIKN